MQPIVNKTTEKSEWMKTSNEPDNNDLVLQFVQHFGVRWTSDRKQVTTIPILDKLNVNTIDYIKI